jgi:hypothetical protein
MRARWILVALIPLLWLGAALSAKDYVGAAAVFGILCLVLLIGFLDRVLWP